jgi:hypothetical protein
MFAPENCIFMDKKCFGLNESSTTACTQMTGPQPVGLSHQVSQNKEGAHYRD